MAIPIRGKPAWIILPAVLLGLSGCGDRSKATVSGQVTYEGQPVESGFITFYPEDTQGTSVGGEIVQGEYSVSDIAPGKKRVNITITEQVDPASTNVSKSREEANAERLSKRKRKPSPSKQPVPGNFSGNNKIVNIGSGSQRLDIPLEKPRPGK